MLRSLRWSVEWLPRLWVLRRLLLLPLHLRRLWRLRRLRNLPPRWPRRLWHIPPKCLRWLRMLPILRGTERLTLLVRTRIIHGLPIATQQHPHNDPNDDESKNNEYQPHHITQQPHC